MFRSSFLALALPLPLPLPLPPPPPRSRPRARIRVCFFEDENEDEEEEEDEEAEEDMLQEEPAATILPFSRCVTVLTASSSGKTGFEMRSSPPLSLLRVRLSKSV